MATVRNTIILNDNMTKVLGNIIAAMNQTISVMQETGRVSPQVMDKVKADLGAAETAILEMNQQLGRTPAKIKEASAGFTVMRGMVANMLSGLALQMGRQLVASFTGAIKTASDLVEVQNLVGVTFGESADIINKWSKTALEAYGLNELSAKKYAGTMGAMLKSSGVAGDAVNKMSMNLVGLAGDMASFYNVSGDEAFNKIRAGISGETEPLKQLGVNMSVANLEAYALAQGIKKSYQQMSQAEQVALRYNYLLQVTADAQGDFERTSDSYANQQKQLNENWKMFTANIMTGALPALTTMTEMLNITIKALEPYAPIIATALGIIGALVVAIIAVTAAQWLWNTAQMASPMNWMVIGIIALIIVIAFLIAWVVDLWRNNVEFRVGIIGIWNSILNFFDKVPLFFQRVGNGIADAFSYVKVAALNSLQDMVNGAIDIINDYIKVLNMIPGVSIEPIAQATFGAVNAASEEAKRQSREESLKANEAGVEAKAATRAAELAEYRVKALEKKTAADAAKANSFNMKDYLSEGFEIDGGNLDSVGKIKGDVKITEEDIKLLRDIAKVEFINQYTTLRPEMNVTFGDVRETADVNQLLDTIVVMVEEAFGSALVGEGT